MRSYRWSEVHRWAANLVWPVAGGRAIPIPWRGHSIVRWDWLISRDMHTLRYLEDIVFTICYHISPRETDSAHARMCASFFMQVLVTDACLINEELLVQHFANSTQALTKPSDNRLFAYSQAVYTLSLANFFHVIQIRLKYVPIRRGN